MLAVEVCFDDFSRVCIKGRVFVIRAVRVLLSLFSTVAFLANGAERALPEVHERGPEAAHVATPAAVGSCAPASQADLATCDRGPDQSPVTPHGPHADHCGHAHGAAQPVANIATVPLAHDSAPVAPMQALVSVSHRPQVRPPIG